MWTIAKYSNKTISLTLKFWSITLKSMFLLNRKCTGCKAYEIFVVQTNSIHIVDWTTNRRMEECPGREQCHRCWWRSQIESTTLHMQFNFRKLWNHLQFNNSGNSFTTSMFYYTSTSPLPVIDLSCFVSCLKMEYRFNLTCSGEHFDNLLSVVHYLSIYKLLTFSNWAQRFLG